MERNEKSLFCAFPNHKHYLLEPILLNCGHSMCKKCISNKHLKGIECGICGNFNKINNEQKNTDKFDIGFDLNLDFDYLKQEFKRTYLNLKNVIKIKEKKLEVDIQYAKDEIEIKVESLKNELDLLRECLFDSLNEYLRRERNDIEKKQYDGYLAKLEENNLNEQDFLNHVAVLKNLQDELKHFETSFTVDFKLCEQKLSSEIISKVNLKNDFHEGKIDNQMLNSYESRLSINSWFLSGCILPNDEIAFCNSADIIIYKNQNFEEILRRIKQINGLTLHAKFMFVSNKEDIIYIIEENRIIMTDINFNFLKLFKSTDFIDFEVVSFNDARLYNDNLYILCELEPNDGILQISNDLNTCKTLDISLYSMGNSIEICNDLLVVKGFEAILFYDLKTSRIRFKYSPSSVVSRFFVVNDYFYAFLCNECIAYCFDKHGLFIDEINFDQHDKWKKFEGSCSYGVFYDKRDKNLIFASSHLKNLSFIYKIE